MGGDPARVLADQVGRDGLVQVGFDRGRPETGLTQAGEALSVSTCSQSICGCSGSPMVRTPVTFIAGPPALD